MTLNSPAGRVQMAAALIALAGMIIAVGGALAFQHIGGYIPCKLCLEERVPYYIGIPVMLLALLSWAIRMPGVVTRGLILIGAAMMVWTMCLGIYHSGVEWAWWPGPTDCQAVSASASTSGGVLDQLNNVIPPSCEKAAGRFLGLSFAGWNVVASLVIALIALRGAFGRAEY